MNARPRAGAEREAELSTEAEVALDGLPVIRQRDWAHRFPWLVQGVTARGLDFSPGPEDAKSPGGVDRDAEGRRRSRRSEEGSAWDRLRRATGFAHVARVRQVHGNRAVRIDAAPSSEAERAEADALAAALPDVLLAITVADCVPVFVVDPERRALGLAHAGWRGAAAGVVERLLERMERDLGVVREALHVHLGPAICGACYEIGPEVAAAFGLDPATHRVDLRARIGDRLAGAGIDPGRVTRSDLCTLCRRDRLLSFRGGDRTARMCAFLGAP